MTNSRRAPIFAEVLKYINSDDWERSDGFLVFGKEAFEAYRDRIWGQQEEDPTDLHEGLSQLVAQVKEHRGKRLTDGRISVTPPTSDLTDEYIREWANSLTAPQRDVVRQALEHLANDREALGGAARLPDTATDDIDAAVAGQMVRALERAVDRLAGFEPMELGADVIHPEYFEEAHYCDLYDLKIAAAVLCRAVLESGLQQIINPPRSNMRKPSERHRSYILRMLDEAGRRREGQGYLDAERREKAERIKEAGDLAIHNPAQFQLAYADKIRDIVDDTRKVIIDLFARS